ncbi:MAG: NAD(P)-binding domain-containing protein [bacterium]
MNVGILGTGAVAKTLAAGFLKHGHAVMLGSRTPATLADFIAANPTATAGTVAEAAAFGEIIVLPVKGLNAADVLRAAGAASLAGKTVIDTTNPIAAAPPVNGVLRYFTTHDDSLMEQLQREFPDARLVKAFSCVGNALMVDPQLAGGRPSMFICGNDASAKAQVRGILDAFGWETEDMGAVEAARAIEPLCMLWCIPGFLRNEWSHAYKVLS